MDNNLSSEDNASFSKDKGKDKNEDQTSHGKAGQGKTRQHKKTTQDNT